MIALSPGESFPACRPRHTWNRNVLLAAAAATTPTTAIPPLDVPTWLWFAFCIGTVALLLFDLLVFHRHAHEPTFRESASWTVFWIVLALIFNGLVWWLGDWQHAVLFFTGYLIEKSLSMDNVFVFMVIFSFFGVPLKYQYRVLFLGILGAIVMRLIFILAAGELLKHFDWLMYVFGAFLVYTGYKLARAHGVEMHPDQNFLLRFARKYLRVAPGTHGEKFFVRKDGKLYVTSLFLVLLVIETTDVVFAVDSVPAIFGITHDTFIVFTSNVFAIMGLRALYFMLAGVIGLFRYLHYGLSAVLVFIGVKMLLHDVMHIPALASLAVITILLGVSIIASIVAARREPTETASNPDEPVTMPEVGPDGSASDAPASPSATPAS
jgi:tellurite resistance protein TerC